ncbi:MAG: hypothetical protein ACFFDW_14875 [Candidatus Thorarchaeota archaeon]
MKEIHCEYDPESKSGTSEDDKKYQTIHWISVKDSIPAEIRIYDQLFTKSNPLDAEEGKDFTDYINKDSLEIVNGYVEPHLKKVEIGSRFQFERMGYYNIDPVDSTKEKLIFNRIIPLRDSLGKK